LNLAKITFIKFILFPDLYVYRFFYSEALVNCLIKNSIVSYTNSIKEYPEITDNFRIFFDLQKRLPKDARSKRFFTLINALEDSPFLTKVHIFLDNEDRHIVDEFKNQQKQLHCN